MRHDFVVESPDEGRGIERFLQKALGGVPPSLVHRLLRKGDVKCNGKRARAGDVLAAGDEIVVHHTSKAAPSKRSGAAPTPPYEGPAIDVLARDPDYLALAKPAGVSCSDDGRDRSSVQAWLASELADEIESGAIRPEPCHRLDRDTSGVVLVALTAPAMTAFHRRLAEGRVRKLYRVLAWGRGPSDDWIDDTPLRRLPHAPRSRPKVVAAPGGGQEARTHFRWISSHDALSLFEAEPLTGRTHQIRAHLYGAGLPLVGDPRYGDPARDRALGLDRMLQRQWLHASELVLEDDGRRYRAPLPDDLRGVLRRFDLPTDA